MRPAAQVLPFRLNDETLRRQIAELAQVSANVFITTHAARRMKKRGILRTQVHAVLTRGRVVEPAHQDIHGCWKCTLRATIAGDDIKVAVALGEDKYKNKVVVITVMN
ncbi:MAG TPA: DUF4258 domain-containing protein [Casimicrobiaceae bacterium]|nr:DUF4258 domain-containing protein [Casimicrobiaceae bacterium]